MSRGASHGAPLYFFREGCPPCDRISMACRYSTCTSTLEQSHVYQKEGNSIDHPTSLSHHEHNRLLHVRLGCLLSAVSMSAYYFHFCDFNYVIFILTLFPNVEDMPIMWCVRAALLMTSVRSITYHHVMPSLGVIASTIARSMQL